MAETKKYVSKRQNFTIHRPPTWEKTQQGGELVQVRRDHPPIEFSGGSYKTSDPDEQRVIEESGAFGETLQEGDVAPAPSEQELEEAAEESGSASSAGEKTLEEKLAEAETAEEKAEILQAAGAGDVLDDEVVPADSGSDSPDEPADNLDEIEGVSNKSDALDALGSIEQANEDVDFDVNSSDTVDTIAEAAEREGYTFVGWPS